jgi:hypothetical protein
MPKRDALEMWANGWRYPAFWAAFFGIFVFGLRHNTVGFAISVIGFVAACAWWFIDQRQRR